MEPPVRAPLEFEWQIIQITQRRIRQGCYEYLVQWCPGVESWTPLSEIGENGVRRMDADPIQQRWLADEVIKGGISGFSDRAADWLISSHPDWLVAEHRHRSLLPANRRKRGRRHLLSGKSTRRDSVKHRARERQARDVKCSRETEVQLDWLDERQVAELMETTDRAWDLARASNADKFAAFPEKPSLEQLGATVGGFRDRGSSPMVDLKCCACCGTSQRASKVDRYRLPKAPKPSKSARVKVVRRCLQSCYWCLTGTLIGHCLFCHAHLLGKPDGNCCPGFRSSLQTRGPLAGRQC